MKKFLILFLFFCTPITLSAAQNWKAVMRYDKQKTKTILAERLLKYTAYNTQADPVSASKPSTKQQLDFAKMLAKELKHIGASNVQLSKTGTVTAEIPATTANPTPVIVLAAAMDIPAGIPAQNIRPQLHAKYIGGDLVLTENEKIREHDYPQLLAAHGHDIITASGGSALGASGKAGIAIIMTLADYLLGNPAVEHGPVKLVFVPDASWGGEQLNIPSLKAEIAYVAQGGNLGEIAAENFSGRSFTAVFEGKSPVSSGQVGALADNLLMTSDFHTLLPRHRRPENTAGQRGFIWVDSIVHKGAKSTAHGIIRAFTDTEINDLSGQVSQAFNTVKAMNPAAKNASLDFKDEFKNAKEKLPPALIKQLEQAMRAEEITPQSVSVRDNTLAGRLTARGLPAAGIFTGVFGPATTTEYADVDIMEASLRTTIRLLNHWSDLEIH